MHTQGKYDEAIEYYDKALTLDPTNVNALISIANVLQELKRYDEAIEYYDKALAL